ncbi:hypothetical protein H1244_004565 [Salmonella enterica]|nr:hypothetical protein [Salmonella enterica]EDJ6269313.1 hypothetical protein [Salmonella enterica]EFR4410547.1 hypothetical protein [Salmonella enterica]EGS7015752.1 hypothetical protein [Salmonella enterica]EHB8486200.1 hypothetical protein [Salmonella enterica]
MRCNGKAIWQVCFRVVGVALTVLVVVLACLLLTSGPAQSTGVSFRFPDTERPKVPDDMATRGELWVSGALISSPCVADGVTGADGTLRLVLTGCGDGNTRTGRVRLREVPLVATVTLGGIHQTVRLNGGANWPDTGVLPRSGAVEVSYE